MICLLEHCNTIDAGRKWGPTQWGGAFAPYERFAGGKTSAQAEFTSAEHLQYRRVEAAMGRHHPQQTGHPKG